MIRRTLIEGALVTCASIAVNVGLVVCAATAAPAFSSLSPAVTRDLRFHQHPGTRLPLGSWFHDALGRSVRLDHFFHDKPVVLVLDYLRCRSLCGIVIRDTARALSEVPLTAGRDYEVVAISIDPRDTSEDARRAGLEYFPRTTAAIRDGTSVPGWHFLTGHGSEINAVAKAVGFPFRYDPKIDQYAHPAGITILTPGGMIARYVLGVGYHPLDVRLALTEAARDTISSPVADLLLLCYCYDPGTGRYNFAIRNLTRALCLTAVLGLGVWIFRLSRRRAELT